MGTRLSAVVGLWAAATIALPALATSAAAQAPSSTSPTSAAATTSPAGAAKDDPQQLTPEELARQVKRAEELRAQILGAGADIKAAVTALEKSTAKANKALQAYSTAQNKERDALAEANRQETIAAALQAQLDDGRRNLRNWAVDVYTRGGNWAESLAFLDALSKSARESSNPLSDLNYLTDNRIRTVEDLRRVTVEQKIASMNADAARATAQEAAAEAKAARDASRKAVAGQRKELVALKAAHQKHIAEAGPLAGLLLGSGDDSSVGAAKSLIDALKAADVDVSDLMLTPCSSNTTAYPNGQYPLAALCKLVGSPDEYLVPRAAAAFNAMSKAYAEATGRLLCVTDGYRSFAEQVIVKAERGPWAATPGTSEHGFGRAVDLCGGVQDYSNPAHLWLVQNAPLYGWFHPDWAAQGGRLPEPWHWEFAG